MPFISISASHVSESGHVRGSNQDCLLADTAQGLWLVADGMGGHAGGEVASHIAITQVPSALDEGCSLMAAFDRAHQAIIAQSQQQPELAGMGTTLVAVQQQGRHMQFAWVGDSRIYHWPNAGELKQVTVDHSFVQDMVIRGVLSPAEAQQHPQKNLISKSLGRVGQSNSAAECMPLKLAAQGLVLLCTDGVTDMLTTSNIKTALATQGSVEDKAAALRSALLATEAADNFSFILLQYHCSRLARLMNFIRR